MVKHFRWQLCGLAIALVLLSSVGFAQAQTPALDSQSLVKATGASQAVVSLLSTLPEADTLIYINPQRILNEAAPKVMADADVAKMREQFTQLKQMGGVDPSRIDYIVVAVRFRKPAVDLSFSGPEVLVVTSGDFSADVLMTMAHSGLQEKLVDEKYGSKTLALMTIDELKKEAEKNPFLKSFTQLGIVPLNSNTMAAGNVSYLKAAVDAAEGRDRISQETLNSLMRDSNALISMAGSPWTSFAKSFGLMGTETNPRAPRCDSRLGDFYAAVTMEGTNFKFRGAMNADNPDTAKIINNLLGGLMKSLPGEDADRKSFPSMLRMISFSTMENEVVLQADFPQQMIKDLIREQMKPKPTAPAAAVKSPAAGPVKKHRVIRKRRSGT